MSKIISKKKFGQDVFSRPATADTGGPSQSSRLSCPTAASDLPLRSMPILRCKMGFGRTSLTPNSDDRSRSTQRLPPPVTDMKPVAIRRLRCVWNPAFAPAVGWSSAQETQRGLRVTMMARLRSACDFAMPAAAACSWAEQISQLHLLPHVGEF